MLVLMDAEKEAKKIVAEGRECTCGSAVYSAVDRTRRLNDAKTEAVQEIAALREQKKTQVQDYERQFSAKLEALQREEEETAQRLIGETAEAFARKKGLVVERLLQAVTDVHPTMHANSELRLKTSL